MKQKYIDFADYVLDNASRNIYCFVNSLNINETTIVDNITDVKLLADEIEQLQRDYIATLDVASRQVIEFIRTAKAVA